MTMAATAATVGAAPRRARDLGTDILLSKLLLLSAAAGPFLAVVASRVINRAYQTYDANGVSVSVGGGSASQLTIVTFSVITVSLAIAVIARGLYAGRGSLTWAAALGVVGFLAALGRDQDRLVLDALVGAVVLIGAGFIPWSREVLRIYGQFTIAVATVILAYSFITPLPDTWLPCRADKCTIAGGLLTGVFWAENGLAMYVVALTPTVAFLRSGAARIYGLLSLTTLLYLTGSRAGYLAFLGALLAYVLLRRMLVLSSDERSQIAWSTPGGVFATLRPIVRLTALAPIVGSLASLFVLVALPPTGLTERGSVYAGLREIFMDTPLLGPGLQALQQLFYQGHAPFLMGTEHGQIPYVLTRTGLIGLFLYALAVGMLWYRTVSWAGAVIALVFVGSSFFFATEAVLTFGYGYGWPLVPLLAVAGALPATERGTWTGTLPEPTDLDTRTRRQRQAAQELTAATGRALRRSGVLAAGLVALGVTAGLLAGVPAARLVTASANIVVVPQALGGAADYAERVALDAAVSAKSLLDEEVGQSRDTVVPPSVRSVVTRRDDVTVSVTVTAAEPGVAATTATQLATTAAAVARISPNGVEYAVVPGIEVPVATMPLALWALSGGALGLATAVLGAHISARRKAARRFEGKGRE